MQKVQYASKNITICVKKYYHICDKTFPLFLLPLFLSVMPLFLILVTHLSIVGASYHNRAIQVFLLPLFLFVTHL